MNTRTNCNHRLCIRDIAGNGMFPLVFFFKWSLSKSPNLTCKSKGVTRASLSSTVHMGLPLPSANLGSMIFPDVSPPVRLLSLWRNRDELNTCSTRFVDFWESRLAVLPDGSAWKGKQAKHIFYKCFICGNTYFNL